MKSEDFDLETLIGLAEVLASKQADGHITLMRFTTGWKVTLGTPSLDEGGREEVASLESYPTLADALEELLVGE